MRCYIYSFFPYRMHAIMWVEIGFSPVHLELKRSVSNGQKSNELFCMPNLYRSKLNAKKLCGISSKMTYDVWTQRLSTKTNHEYYEFKSILKRS